MLDTPKQIAAWKLLQHGGAQSAHSVSVSNSYKTTAAAKGTALAALKKTTNANPYPSTITAALNQLTSFAGALTGAGAGYDALYTALEHYNDIEELVNMSIGWDCHIKGEGLAAGTPFPLVEGLAEVAKVDTLKGHVDAFDATAITAAMNSINATLATAPAVVPPATTAVAPTLTQAQIDALTTALTAQQAHITAITTATAPVNDLAARAKASADLANSSFRNAIRIALIVVLQQDPLMAKAITALVPANVLAALK